MSTGCLFSEGANELMFKMGEGVGVGFKMSYLSSTVCGLFGMSVVCHECCFLRVSGDGHIIKFMYINSF